ncbi:MAG: Ig-like domain-containing protein [Bacilli bacterium]|nr:Ig-like domain-containing protein [Bacilli bacterium]
MKKRISLLLLIIIVGFITIKSVYASNIINITLDGTYNYDEANKVVDIVNIERKKAGLNELSIDYELTKVANLRAKEISIYFAHKRSTGKDLSELNIIGENIAAGSTTAESVMNDWMNSSGHKSNILSNYYNSIGVASFKTSNGVTYWVQVFNSNKKPNNKRLNGIREIKNEEVEINLSLIKNIKVYDLQYKKLKVGEEYTISKASIQNIGWDRAYTVINNSNFKYTSNNTSVLTVDNKGIIKGISNGKAIVTISIGNISTNYEIQVGEEIKEVEKLSFTNSEYSMYVGSTLPYSVTVLPNDAVNKLSWSSSDTSIATVDDGGNVSALKSGTTIISVTSSNNKKATFKLNVKEKSTSNKNTSNEKEVVEKNEKEIVIDRVNINCTDITLKVGESFTPSIEVFPKNTTEFINPSWIGFDYRIAEVSSNGTITGKSAGSGYVKVVVGKNNIEGICKINVVAPAEVERMEFSFIPARLKSNEVRKMNINIYPESAKNNANLIWSSSDESIATVNQSGVLFTHSTGEVTITVTATNGVNTSTKIIIE